MATIVNTNLNASLPSIYEELLHPGEILVLMLPSNAVEPAIGPDMSVAIFRVSRRNFLYAKIPLGNLAQGSSVGFDRLTLAGIEHESGKQDIFSVSNSQQFVIYHAAVCTDQNVAAMRIGIENPAGQLVTGFAGQTPPSESPTPNGDVFGWVRDDLAQNNGVATILTEQVYLYNLIPNFALYLESGASAAMTSGNALVHGAGYTLSQIADQSVQDKILAGSYKSITKFKTYGAMLPFNAQMPPQWTPPRSLSSVEFDKLTELIASVR